MKELIWEQINQVSKLEDKVILKELLNGVFLSLYEENKKMYEKLEKRVFEEVEYEQSSYDIQTGIIKKEEYDNTHHLLAPILKEDVVERTYDLDEITKCLKEKIPYFVLKVFVQCDYLVFQKILQEKKIVKGEVITDKKAYSAYFSIEQDNSYFERLQELYQVFIRNGIAWKTVNAPYITRMIKVYLKEMEGKIAKGETIKEIVADFEEYQTFICYNMVPVWNVKELLLQGMGFPIPCEDHINFEHYISISKYGEQNGYLIEEEKPIQYIRREEKNMIVTGKIEESQIWKVDMIVQKEPKKIDTFSYPLMTNKRKKSFIERLYNKNGKSVKTKAELIRFIEGFSFQDYFLFSDIEIREKEEGQMRETYNMNYFIEDEIRDKDYGKRLILFFHAKKSNFFAIRDIMSFVVSEIQLLYPEYHCEGKLV